MHTGRRFALLLVAFLCALPLTGCVTSKIKMLAEPGQAIAPESVALYGSFPRRYRQVAFVEAHIYGSFFMSDQARRRQAVDSLAASAASVGANGLLIRNFHPGSVQPFGSGFRAFRMGTSDNSFSHMTVMHALAIEVP
jgi:hypothetical protein